MKYYQEVPLYFRPFHTACYIHIIYFLYVEQICDKHVYIGRKISLGTMLFCNSFSSAILCHPYVKVSWTLILEKCKLGIFFMFFARRKVLSICFFPIMSGRYSLISLLISTLTFQKMAHIECTTYWCQFSLNLLYIRCRMGCLLVL